MRDFLSTPSWFKPVVIGSYIVLQIVSMFAYWDRPILILLAPAVSVLVALVVSKVIWYYLNKALAEERK